MHIQCNIEKEHNFSLLFLTYWLNAKVVMVIPPLTAFYLPQFRENPHTLKDIFTACHIISNIRSSMLPKFYQAGKHPHITSKIQKHSELQNICNTLQLNGFSTRTTFLTSCRQKSENTQYNHFTSIPYIQGTSEQVRRIINEAWMKVVMRPVRTNGKILCSPKDPHSPEEKSYVV